jgi:hypothetical protein
MQSKMEEEVKKMEEKVAQAALLSDTTSVAVEGDVDTKQVSFIVGAFSTSNVHQVFRG